MNLMNMKALMTSAGVLALTTGFAAAAPAVVGSSVSLRSGPGIDYAVIGALPGGATVDVMGCRGNWCQVNFGGMIGFASRGYLGIGGVAVAPAYGPSYAYGAYAPGYREGAYGAYAPGYRYREGSAPGYGGSLSYGGEREVRGARALSGEQERTRAAEVQGANPMLNPKNEAPAGANTRAEGTRASERSTMRTTRRTQTTGAGQRATTGAGQTATTGAGQSATTGAGTGGNAQNRGPNFIGAGANFKDNHP